MVTSESFLQGFEAAQDVEVLMERMRQLQESLLWDEGASQEEMESRFELEKSESLLVTPSGAGSQASRCRITGIQVPEAARLLHHLCWGAGTPCTAPLVFWKWPHLNLPFQEVLIWGQNWI